MRSALPWMIAIPVLFGTTVASASVCDDPRSEWLMCEDFEGAAAGWESWFASSGFVSCNGCSGSVNNPDRVLLSNDPAHVFDGNYGLHMPGAASANYQGAELTFRSCVGDARDGCTLRGYDELYFRTRVKLAADHDYVHHFLSIGGSRPSGFWDSGGNAGCRPNGVRAAGTTVDFNRSHELFFYTYYPDMRCDSGGYCSGSYAQNICDGCATKDMPCSDGLECCWGNHFKPAAPVILPKDEWVCLEMRMRINTPGVADGEMAFWINDTLGHEASGIRWRDIPELQLNKANLSHYVAPGDTDQPNRISFDDVIVSTSRIGCDFTPDPDPGTDPGTGPGSDAGTDPGTEPGTDSGTDPGTDPGRPSGDAGPGAPAAAPPLADATMSGGCNIGERRPGAFPPGGLFVAWMLGLAFFGRR